MASGFWLWLKISGLALTLIGWGDLAVRVIAGKKSSQSPAAIPTFFESGIAGLCAVYLVSIAASTVCALGGPTQWIFVATGAAGLVALGKRGFQSARDGWTVFVIFAGLSAFIAYGTIRTEWNYDAGLYHLQEVAYFRSGPLPLGIANIHSRLGFNSSWFAISALCAGPVFGQEGSLLLNAAAMVIFLGALASRLIQGLRTGALGIAATLAAAVLLIFVACGALFWHFGLSPSPDLPSALSCAYTFCAFLTFAQGLGDSEQARSGRAGAPALSLLAMVLSASLAVTAKLSQVPVLLLAVPMVALKSLRFGIREVPHLYRILSFGALIIAGWMVQGIMTSGCFAYPAGASCLSFLPWAADPAKANLTASTIHSWAQVAGTPASRIPPGIGWVSIWYDQVFRWREFAAAAVWIGLGLLLVGGVLSVWRLCSNERNWAASRRDLVTCARLALLISVIGVAFWFLAAPDPRFGLGFLVAAPALGFALLAGPMLHRGAGIAGRLGFLIVPVLVLAASVFAADQLYESKSPRWSWRQVPAPQLFTTTSTGGVTMRVPAEGDQCWDAAIPCTPEPPATLQRSTLLGHVMYSR